MTKGLNNKLAAQTGEYLVCAELGRRGLIATPFAGNVPTFDVLATDEQCRTVPIQVKASRARSWPSDARRWMKVRVDRNGRQHFDGALDISHPTLIYVCVWIAPVGERDRYFILTRSQLQQVCIESYTRRMDRCDWKRPRNPDSFECRYYVDAIAQFENNWQIITERLFTAEPHTSLADTDIAALVGRG